MISDIFLPVPPAGGGLIANVSFFGKRKRYYTRH
jgi:hypothetical protein